MNLPAIDLETATAADCIEYAAENLGVRIPGNSKDETARHKLKELLAAEGVVVDPKEQISREVDPEPAQARPLGKRVKMMIPEDRHDKQPVYVSVNFKGFLIQRGKEVEVPEAVIGVLKNATVDLYDKEMNKMQSVPAYPFQILGYV